MELYYQAAGRKVFVMHNLFFNNSLEKSRLYGGELILSNIGSIGKVFRVPMLNMKMTLASNSVMIKCNSEVDYSYLYYFFLSPLGYQELLDITTGTAVLKFNKTQLKTIPVPYPTENVRKNVVTFLDNEFLRFDEAKDQIQSVLDSSEERKQSILLKAVQGDLSAEWRKENNIDINTWKNMAVRDACHDVKVGIVIKPTQYYTDQGGYKAFRSANVREFHIQDSDWVYIDQKGQDKNQRTVVHTGDVLIVRSGNPGTACVVTEEFDGCNAIDIIIAVPNSNIITSEYLSVFTNSPIGKMQVKSGVRGMALTHFNVGSYSKLQIKVPDIKEQKYITSVVKKLLNRLEEEHESAVAALDKIEETRKAILSKAFRGELHV